MINFWKPWLYALCFLILSASITNAYANNIDQLNENTTYFIKLSESLAHGIPLTAETRKEMTTQASKRVLLLTQAIHQDPTKVARYTLPKTVLNRLPQNIQAMLESEMTNVEGKLEIRAVVHLKAPEIMQYILQTADGKQYYLTFNDKLTKTLKTDSVLRIKHAVALRDATGTERLLLAPSDIEVIKEGLALPLSFGPQKTLVMLVNFQDRPTDKPWTSDQVKSVVFTSVNGMYNEASFKQTTVVGQVVGWYTIPLSSTSSCNTITNGVADLAVKAAQNAGIDVNSYPRRVFMFPKVSSCGWAGLGSVGGSTTKAWLNGYNVAGITAHEMGHNIGLYHSHLLRCSGSPNTGNCSTVEYGDVADSMGAGTTAHFNAFQKERLGWLNYSKSPPIRTITSSGSYTIDPFETQNLNPKALKILKKSGSSNEYYYLEFRQAIGYDSVLNCSGCDYTQGIIVHQGDLNNPDSSFLLDMSPTDNTTRRVALLPGQTFKDPNAPSGGVSITVGNVTTTGATVNISFGDGTPTCVRAAPSMVINPSTTQYVQAGGTANYVITLRNNDNANCGASSFNFTTTSANACVRTTLNPNTLRLSPGTSGTVNLSVLTSNILDVGVYDITVKGFNSTAIDFSAQVIASLGISPAILKK